MYKKAFTLIELLVVIAMVAILSTISFMSFNSFIEWSRDANRIAQINNIRDWVAIKMNEWKFLMPTDALEIQHNWNTVSYQWYFGRELIEEIWYSMDWIDPKDKTYFLYTISANWKYFQIMSYLEKESSIKDIWYDRSLVFNNNARIPYIVWNKEIWMFFDDNIVPLNDVLSWVYNIQTWDTDLLNVMLRNDRIISWTWDDIFSSIENVVENFWNNIYSCSAQEHAYAIYIVWSPTVSNTPWQNSNSSAPCYFTCRTWFSWDWNTCRPSATSRTQWCAWNPSLNFAWNTTGSITQTWDESLWDYIPSNLSVYNTTPSSTECRFICNANHGYDPDTNTCIAWTQNILCTEKPENSTWNTVSEIVQSWNWSSWLPSNNSVHNITASTNECRFVCNENYTWNWTSCEADVRNNINCWPIPTNAVRNTATQITQTWNWSTWFPSNASVYNTSSSSTECRFQCAANYSWNWSSCIADTRTNIACTWLPANSSWNTATTISQIWTWTSWSPNSVWVHNLEPSPSQCRFTCNSWYVWDWTSCNFVPFIDFKNILVDKCSVSSSDFDTRFNYDTWVYNWSINCSWAWLTDSDLTHFNSLRDVTWNLDLSNNSLTTLNWLNQLWRVSWNFVLNNNSLTNISALSSLWHSRNINLSNNNLSNLNWLSVSNVEILNLSDNNLSTLDNISNKWSIQELYLQNNNIVDINWLEWKSSFRVINLNWNNISNLSVFSRWLSWLRELYLADNNISNLSWLAPLNIDILHLQWNSWINNLSEFNSVNLESRTLRLNNINYSTKISFLSRVCHSWTLQDQSWNTITDKSNICREPAWSYTNFNWWNQNWWLVDLSWTNSHPSNWWNWWFWQTPTSNTWPTWSFDWDRYLFIETSNTWWNTWNSYRTSILQYELNDSSNYINFYYHAYGNGMWIMRLDALVWWNWQTIHTINWQQHTNRNRPWTQTPDITIPNWTTRLRFHYTSWNNHRWDFSIDAITLWER